MEGAMMTGSGRQFSWSDTPSDSGSERPLAVGLPAADVSPAAPAALGQVAEAPVAATKRAPGPKSGTIIGSIGGVLVYVETEARSVYEPVKVWVVETSAEVRGAIEARAGPVVQKWQAAGQPLIVYMMPMYAKVTNCVLSVHSAAGNKAITVKSRAMQLKGDCAGQVLAAYGAACRFADVTSGLIEATAAPIKARGLELYRAGEANALPYYVKARGTTVMCCQKAKDGAHYVETRVGDIVLMIKVRAGDKATLIKSAVLSGYAAVSDFVGGYTGPVAAKLAAMYQVVISSVSRRLSPMVAKALEYNTIVYTKACNIAVVVKVKSLAVKGKATQYKDNAMQYPSALLVQIKDGYVYMKKVTDEKVVVIKANLFDVLASLNSALLQIKEQAKLQAATAFDTAHVQYLALRARTTRIAVDPNARVTAASAVGGATVMGAGGGAAGLVTGGTLGAVCGVPLSLFTFGLSIPVGAAVGSAAGLCAGVVTGGTAGLVGGGAAGYKVHQKKDSIAEGFSAAASKVSDIKGMAVEKVSMYKTKVVDSTEASASYVRSRFAGGTGGTDEDR